MTKVTFLKKDGEVFAFFPKETWGPDPYEKTCYASMEGHSPCHIQYASESTQADPEEYKDLQKELEGIGYKLLILNKPKGGFR